MADKVESIFEKSGAILKGHFLLTSGLHSPVYWEKFQVLQSPVYTEQLCKMMADHFKDRKPQVVAGPTTGGVILSHEVARLLGVRGIFAEKIEGTDERAFRRGFHIAKGERVLLVDDILTTGKSVRQVVNAINKLGGDIIGIGVMVDRSEKPMDFGAPLFACLRSETITYKPEACPLCQAGVPLVKPGGG